jgi:hypothetical protein
VWDALPKVNDLALRLLNAGVTVCASDEFGADRDGQKNFRDIALWIGRNLEQQRNDLAFKVGAWGIKMLHDLPIFRLVDHDAEHLDVLTLLPDIRLDQKIEILRWSSD